MSLSVTRNGSSITAYVVSYERSQNICSGVGTLSLTLDSTYSMDSIDPYDIIIITEDGIVKGKFYVISVEKTFPDSTVNLQCQDGSLILMDYFIDQSYNTENTAYYASYWITTFLTQSGVSFTFDTYDRDSLVSNNTYMGMSSAYDAIVPLLAQCGWYMYFDTSGTCHINRIENSINSITLSDNQILTFHDDKNDKMFRNRAVVWGAADPFGAGYVFADLQIFTPWNYDTNDLRTVVIQNPNIPSNSVATELANQVLNSFSQLTDETTVDVAGYIDVKIGYTAYINSHFGRRSGIVTTVVCKTSSSGKITTVSIGERCPRIVAYFNYNQDNVYIGTSGNGIWYKPIQGSGWVNYSTGLYSNYVNDLDISNGVFATVVDKNIYTRTLYENSWTPYTIPDLVNISGGIVYSAQLEAQAVAVNPINNNTLAIVNTKGRYYEMNGFPALNSVCNSWLLEIAGSDHVLISAWPITVSGMDRVYAYDIDTDGKDKYISIITQQETGIPGVCDGIDISPIATYVDYSNDATLADLVAHEDSSMTVEGWFFVHGDHTGVPGEGYPQYWIHWNDIFERMFFKFSNDEVTPGWGFWEQYKGRYPAPQEPYTPWLGFSVVYHNPYRMPLDLDPLTSEWISKGYQIGESQYDLQYNITSDWHHVAFTAHTFLDYGNVWGGEGNFINCVVNAFVDGHMLTNNDGWVDSPPEGYYDRVVVDTDTDEDVHLTMGDYSVSNPLFTRDMKLNWSRISDNIRYSGDFNPDDCGFPPSPDIHTLALWHNNSHGPTVPAEVGPNGIVIGTATYPSGQMENYMFGTGYGIVRTSGNVDFQVITATPNLAKIEIDKGNPLVVYGGNQYYNNGFVYYSTDGYIFNNLNLIEYGLLGNPSLSGNAFVSDAVNFDTVSGVTFTRYTGIVQHNLYQGKSEVRLARYDLNPVWQSPTLSGVCVISGCLDHIETSNNGYLHSPYIFLSTISGDSYNPPGSAISRFYQINKDDNYMYNYSAGLPNSKVTIIKLDKRV